MDVSTQDNQQHTFNEKVGELPHWCNLFILPLSILGGERRHCIATADKTVIRKKRNFVLLVYDRYENDAFRWWGQHSISNNVVRKMKFQNQIAWIKRWNPNLCVVVVSLSELGYCKKINDCKMAGVSYPFHQDHSKYNEKHLLRPTGLVIINGCTLLIRHPPECRFVRKL